LLHPYRLELAATLGIDHRKLGAANSGRSRWSTFELDTYLHGASAWSIARRGLTPGKWGERPAAGSRQGSAPNCEAGKAGRPPAHQKRPRQHALAALGAAGKFPLTPDQAETERLKSLHETDLLNTGPEEPFDRIVGAARKFFNVGAASMSLIDGDVQHFKSVLGPLRDETPRQIALCTETVERNSMLVIHDTLTDDRFASNPLVLGDPHIRFYAGFPLHGPRGWNIGTLCIIDQKPRPFPPSEQQVLRILAATAQSYIDARTQPPAGQPG
ncbi:GAF domain-containing protein, partial [Arthrobacter sp. ISL-85]|uniref:GAF domain-containing protein n=1 Tax=Arthrobacter sp. ISL-85 TaxID=2819115 RepID=UPI001BEC3122